MVSIISSTICMELASTGRYLSLRSFSNILLCALNNACNSLLRSILLKNPYSSSEVHTLSLDSSNDASSPVNAVQKEGECESTYACTKLQTYTRYPSTYTDPNFWMPWWRWSLCGQNCSDLYFPLRTKTMEWKKSAITKPHYNETRKKSRKFYAHTFRDRIRS